MCPLGPGRAPGQGSVAERVEVLTMKGPREAGEAEGSAAPCVRDSAQKVVSLCYVPF